MTGYVDEERRPLIRVALSGGHAILALIDTGFDGYLWFTEPDALACGVDFDRVFERDVLLAGRRPISVAKGWLTVEWMGHEMEVEVLIDLDNQRRTIDSREPAALIGTQLISPAALVIDFGAHVVAIERCDSIS